MTDKEFRRLDIGDLIVHQTNSTVYVVTANYGNRVTAVRTVDVTNPDEWNIVRVCERTRAELGNFS